MIPLGSSLYSPPPQPDNPTDAQRHALEKYALIGKGRPEDFDYIVKLTAPPPDIGTLAPPGSLKGTKVGIIGAGLAGLCSAYELRKTGAGITLFEASDTHIGGRVYTYYFDRSGLIHGELGAMRIPVSHETIWHYIKLLRLNTRPFIQNNPNALIYLKKTRVRNDPQGRNVMDFIYPKYRLTERERQTPWQQLVYYGLESPLLTATPAQRSELLQVKPVYNAPNTYWDCQSNRSIMEALGLSQGAIELIASLFPLAGQNLYSSFADIAQANYPANLTYLYELSDGASTLPYALYNSLISPEPQVYYPGFPAQYLGPVGVRLGNWVTGIHRDATGKVLLEYQNRQSRGPLFESFDYVICAIPFSTLRTIDISPLFSSLKMQAIREVNYIPSQK
ncbi:MAG: FAD-dependent oxidoreductase, partial [Clostridia bacterium]|nr:FAD-dependent oxidoreductase [Clostridia bacterium]